ncbi:hypothetical protein OG285_36735 (plasmid) [Streptomyces sp. NBC_01471]|uniref:hypothetical protein n=1 Tax=Streptomyces sp. NBC_01471 TaxID=2903879 RepID=UPI002F9081BB
MGADRSKYDATPLDPNAGGGGSDSAPPTFNGTVPDVHVAWGSPPPVVADTSKGNSSDSIPPEHNAFKVDIGSIKESEQGMLSAGSIMVDAYENLKNMVLSSQEIFGQNATVTTTRQGNQAAASGAQATSDTNPSPVQDAAKQFASYIFPAEENVLEQVADSLELIGQLVAAFNGAAQAYATADYKSAFPVPAGY